LPVTPVPALIFEVDDDRTVSGFQMLRQSRPPTSL
jgi:hypothetical protein